MTALKQECVAEHAKKLFAVSEKQSEVRFSNPNERKIQEVRIDGCVIDDDGVRCDYLINVNDMNVTVLVELKGSNIPHALKQLERTHSLLPAHMNEDVTWIVATSRSPLTSTQIQVQALRIKKHRKAKLVVRNSPVEHDIL